jgi:hypothetical protein
MKLSLIIRVSLCALAVTGLVSCGGSGDTSSTTTSTTTSGSAVVGTISGFGSIIMDNGVEYETDGLSSCEVDDLMVAGVCEDSLSTGMHVTLHTDANGVVTSLKYDDELEGVASNITGTGGNYTFEVFGATVTTVNPDTQWDDFSTNPPTDAELKDANVEVSGEWLNGTLIASYVEKQGAGDTDHEVKGTVGVISGSDFPLTLRDGVTIIDVDGSALSSLPEEGSFIELKGTFDSATSKFIATDSEIEDADDFDSDSEAEITGTLVEDTESSTGFSIGNTEVDISGASSCTGLTGSLVEAEGAFSVDTGVLVVEECENEDGDMEAKCMVSNNAIVPDSTKPKVGSVECSFTGTTGGPLTIKFNDTPDIAMFSGDSTAITFDLSDVHAGDCVEIKFSKDANGDYIADLIEHEGSGQCESYELEATVDSFNDGIDITVLGVTFTANPTVYEPSDSNASLNVGDKVKIIDDDADGNADKIEVD